MKKKSSKKTKEINFDSIEEMVKFYNQNYRHWLDNEIKNCSLKLNSDLCDCLKADYLLVCSSHQFRLRSYLKEKEEAVIKLKNNKLWEREYENFEDLYLKVNETLRNISQIGDLTIYDVAKRIGGYLGIEPQEYVYLSCGAKIGAESLLGEKISTFKIVTKKFEPYFPDLTSIHIENLLCFMKDFFIKGGINTQFKKCMPLKDFNNENE